MVCRSSTGHNWQAANDGGRVKTRTCPELTGEVGGLDWWCWRLKLQGAGPRKFRFSWPVGHSESQKQNQFVSRL